MMADFTAITEVNRLSREAVKQRINFCLYQMDMSIQNHTLSKACYVRQSQSINALLDSVAADTRAIDDLCVRNNIPLDDVQVLEDHLKPALLLTVLVVLRDFLSQVLFFYDYQGLGTLCCSYQSWLLVVCLYWRV